MKLVCFVFSAVCVLTCRASSKLSLEKSEKIQRFLKEVKEQESNLVEGAARRSEVVAVSKPSSSPPSLQIRAGTEEEAGAIVRRLSAHFDVAIDNVGGDGFVSFRNMNLELRKKSAMSADEAIEGQRPSWTKRWEYLYSNDIINIIKWNYEIKYVSNSFFKFSLQYSLKAWLIDA